MKRLTLALFLLALLSACASESSSTGASAATGLGLWADEGAPMQAWFPDNPRYGRD